MKRKLTRVVSIARSGLVTKAVQKSRAALRAAYRKYRDYTEKHRRQAMAVALLFVFLVGMAVPFIVSERTTHAWWNTSWLNRRTITINNTASSSTLTNFPIRVSLTSSNITYANTKAAGADIRFVDSDDTTALSYQIESWNNGGTSEIWVKIPSLTATNYTIYMYYNNTAATDAQAATSVWNWSASGGGGYLGVWHLGETGNGTAGEYKDSTSNALNGRGGAGTSTRVPTTTTGQIGTAQTFSESGTTTVTNNDYIQVPTSTLFNFTGNITMSAWIKRNVATNYGAIMGKVSGSATSYDLYTCHATSECTSKTNSIGAYSDGTSPTGVASTAQLTDTTGWHYVVASRSSTTLSLYIDGTLDRSTSWTGSFPGTGYVFNIGVDNPADQAGTFNGSIDEARLANGSRTADEVKADYLTGTNAMNTFGSEQTQKPNAPTLTTVSSPASATPVFQMSATAATATTMKYRVDVCSTNDCSSIVRTADQTSSQTGWSGQDAGGGTAYVGGTSTSTTATYTYQTPALSYGTTYYWRAYAYDVTSGSWSDPSTIASFSTMSTPAAPTLSSPADGATISTGNGPVFQMKSTDADSTYARYKIEVCSVSDCSSVVRTIDQTSSQTGWTGQDSQTSTAYVIASTLASSTTASHTYQAPALTNHTQYWWRAYAIDPGGTNTWSSASTIRSFTYEVNEAPAAPTLVSPLNGQVGLSIIPQFRLRTTDYNSDYIKYKVQVCTNSDCSSVLQTADQTSSQTGWSGQDAQSGTAYNGSNTITSASIANYAWSFANLSTNTTYYWRAYAIDPGGSNTWSTASAIQPFTTGPHAGTQDKTFNGGVKINGGTTIGN